MTTVVQTNYRPEIAGKVAGLVANMMDAAIRHKVVETAAGIGFGLAVSQGTGDGGCVLGSTKFIGVTVRDVTVALAQVDPLSDTPNTVDTYGLYTNAAILSRGDIWVVAGNNVAAGDAASYNTTTGAFSTGTSGTAATGKITFTQQPDANDTIALDGHNITFKASGAVAASDEVNIGPTLGDTIRNIATLVANNTSTNLGNVKAIAYPPSPGGAGEGSGANELHVAAAAVGTGGNSIALSAGTVSGATASGAALAGGTASTTAITGGRWATSAQAGELALLSLGLQA